MKRFACLFCLAVLSVLESAAQSGTATVQYHWIAGDAFTVLEKNNDISHQTSDSGDAESEQVFHNEFGHTWKINSVSPDGTATISVSFTHVRVEAAINQVQQLIFDSRMPDSNKGDPATLSVISDYCGAMQASTLVLKITSSGTVLSVGGIDELTDRLRDVAEKEKTRFRVEDRILADQVMEAMVSNETSPKTYSFFLLPAPGRAVSLGDSWTQKLEIPLQAINLQVTRTLRILEITANSVKMEIGTNVELPSDKPIPVVIESVPGIAEFARTSGLPTSLEWGIRIKMPVLGRQDGREVRVGHSDEVIQTHLDFMRQESSAKQLNSPEFQFSASFPCAADEKIADPSRAEGVNFVAIAPSRIVVFTCFKKDRYRASIEVAELATAGQPALDKVVSGLTAWNPDFRVTDKRTGTLQGYPSVKFDVALTLIQGQKSHYLLVGTEHRVYLLRFIGFSSRTAEDDAAGKAFLESFHLNQSN